MYTLIDSPITPYSTSDEIHNWLKQLQQMEKSNEVKDEINRCTQLLEEISE